MERLYNLFLDDTRNPEDVYEYTFQRVYLDAKWTIVRSYDEFVQMIKTFGMPNILSFDHDLGLEHYDHRKDISGKLPYDQYTEKTGYHCAKWLIDYCIDNNLELPETILIHTMNVIGGQNIASLFNTYKKVHGK